LGFALPVMAQRMVNQPAQRGGPAGPDTKRVLIATFTSQDRRLGVEASDAVRKRVQDQYSMKQLWVVPKPEMDATLKGSGYPEDTALATTDLMELGKALRADYYVDGVARKTEDGVALQPRLQLKRGGSVLTEPLPAVSAKNFADVAKTVLKMLEDALKAMPAYIACEADLRAQRYDAAAADGRAAIAAYPASLLGRLCLLTAFNKPQAAPDSIIRVGNEILASDSTSVVALTTVADAYLAKSDTARAIDAGLKAWRLDESNRTLVVSIIGLLVNSGHADRALGLTEEVLRKDPAASGMLRTRWQLLLRLKRFREAVVAGEEMVKADTAEFTPDYPTRTGAAAALDSQFQVAAGIYERGVARFPKDAQLNLAYAQVLTRLGQLEKALAASHRAVANDSKLEAANIFVLNIELQLGHLDSVVAIAPRAIANGVPKAKVAEVLVGVLAPTVRKAQESKTREAWQETLKTAQMVDQIAPAAVTKYYVGVSAYSIGADAANQVTDLNNQLRAAKPAAQKAIRTKACEQAKIAEDHFAIATVAMSQGGGHEKDTAAQIMTGLGQAGEFITQAKTTFCK